MTTDTVAGTPSAAPPRRVGWAPLVIVLIGTFVFVFDFFVVNVALPAMEFGLHAGPSVLEWVVAGYSLTAAATLVSGGAATVVHEGALANLDMAYGALGIELAERGGIGLPGPIREYYLVSAFDTDDESRHRTEVCWPVFRTVT